MSYCTFADGAAIYDATPVENLFLVEHLYDAPASALKVYLYARMLALHPELGDGPADLARALRMDEEAIEGAFDYWERRQLMKRVSDQPPAYVFLPIRTPGDGMSALDREMYANRDFNYRLQKLFGENLIGDHELRKAADWQHTLHMDRDAIVRLVEYGIETSRVKNPKPPSVFKRMDKLAEAWSGRGVRTLAEMERAIAEERGEAQLAREVLKKLGIPRQPTEPELEAVRRWTGEWSYDREAVLAACDETLNSRNPSFAYLETVLKNRAEGDGADRRAMVEALRELRPMGAQPSPEDEKRYRALLEAGFTSELIRLAAVQCHQNNRHTLDDLEWRLNLWREEGLTTAAEVEAYTKKMAVCSRRLRAIFKRAGYPDRKPGYNDIVRYQAWAEQSPEPLIDYAAECAKNAGGSTAYMDALLTAWREAGIDTVEAARVQHESRRAAAAQPGAVPANPALDYRQREYRDEDFGDDFFEDLSAYAKEDDAK